MPLYAYQCKKCGSEEEHLQKLSDPPVRKCTACGGRLERMMTAAAFHLKGGGWYKDGYASQKPDAGGGESADSSSSDSDTSGSDTKKESKADKKKDSKKKSKDKSSKAAT